MACQDPVLDGEGAADPDAYVDKSPDGVYARWDRLLGAGAFKHVYEAFDTESCRFVAWCEVHTDAMDEEEQSQVRAEAELLTQLEHPRVLRCLAAWTTPTSLVLITELKRAGTLRAFALANKPKLKVLKRWVRDILVGVAYLHAQDPPVVHRDIKPDNVLYESRRGDVFISDLGLATRLAPGSSRMGKFQGTANFMAPELYDDRYTQSVDVYAVGMLVVQLVSGSLPYAECDNEMQIYAQVTKGNLPAAFHAIRHDSVKEYVRFLTQVDPVTGRRPTAQEALAHPFLVDSLGPPAEGGGVPSSPQASSGGGSSPLASPPISAGPAEDEEDVLVVEGWAQGQSGEGPREAEGVVSMSGMHKGGEGGGETPLPPTQGDETGPQHLARGLSESGMAQERVVEVGEEVHSEEEGDSEEEGGELAGPMAGEEESDGAGRTHSPLTVSLDGGTSAQAVEDGREGAASPASHSSGTRSVADGEAVPTQPSTSSSLSRTASAPDVRAGPPLSPINPHTSPSTSLEDPVASGRPTRASTPPAVHFSEGTGGDDRRSVARGLPLRSHSTSAAAMPKRSLQRPRRLSGDGMLSPGGARQRAGGVQMLSLQLSSSSTAVAASLSRSQSFKVPRPRPSGGHRRTLTPAHALRSPGEEEEGAEFGGLVEAVPPPRVVTPSLARHDSELGNLQVPTTPAVTSGEGPWEVEVVEEAAGPEPLPGAPSGDHVIVNVTLRFREVQWGVVEEARGEGGELPPLPSIPGALGEEVATLSCQAVLFLDETPEQCARGFLKELTDTVHSLWVDGPSVTRLLAPAMALLTTAPSAAVHLGGVPQWGWEGISLSSEDTPESMGAAAPPPSPQVTPTSPQAGPGATSPRGTSPSMAGTPAVAAQPSPQNTMVGGVPSAPADLRLPPAADAVGSRTPTPPSPLPRAQDSGLGSRTPSATSLSTGGSTSPTHPSPTAGEGGIRGRARSSSLGVGGAPPNLPPSTGGGEGGKRVPARSRASTMDSDGGGLVASIAPRLPPVSTNTRPPQAAPRSTAGVVGAAGSTAPQRSTSGVKPMGGRAQGQRALPRTTSLPGGVMATPSTTMPPATRRGPGLLPGGGVHGSGLGPGPVTPHLPTPIVTTGGDAGGGLARFGFGDQPLSHLDSTSGGVVTTPNGRLGSGGIGMPVSPLHVHPGTGPPAGLDALAATMMGGAAPRGAPVGWGQPPTPVHRAQVQGGWMPGAQGVPQAAMGRQGQHR